MTDTKIDSKTKLLNAALQVILGTKGRTIHASKTLRSRRPHQRQLLPSLQKQKEDLALQAAEHWSSPSPEASSHPPPTTFFPTHSTASSATSTSAKYFSVATCPSSPACRNYMVQEVYDTHPPSATPATKASRRARRPPRSRHRRGHPTASASTPDWTPESLALYTQAALQGSFILAKAKGGPAIASTCIDHLRRYIKLLFTQPNPRRAPHDNEPAAIH